MAREGLSEPTAMHKTDHKSWTVRTQGHVVTHHATGQKFRLREYLEGDYEVCR